MYSNDTRLQGTQARRDPVDSEDETNTPLAEAVFVPVGLAVGSKQESTTSKRRYFLYLLGLLVVAAACVAGVCGTGHCSRSTEDPTSPSATEARAQSIRSYINSVSFSDVAVEDIDVLTPEGQAMRWLIDNDIRTSAIDFVALRQRYVLALVWFQSHDFVRNSFDDSYQDTWLSAAPECEWVGVDCIDGVIVTLDLAQANAQGQIPKDVGLLNELRHLSLWDNSFTGTVPTTLGLLTNLRFFSLAGNELTGTLPSSLMSIVGLEQGFFHNNNWVGAMPFCEEQDPASIVDLQADCNEVDCPCCTGCCPIGGWDGITSANVTCHT